MASGQRYTRRRLLCLTTPPSPPLAQDCFSSSVSRGRRRRCQRRVSAFLEPMLAVGRSDSSSAHFLVVGPKLHMYFSDLAALATNSACLSNVCCPDRRYLYDSATGWQTHRPPNASIRTLPRQTAPRQTARRSDGQGECLFRPSLVVRSELTAIPPPLSQGLSRVQVRCSTSFILCSRLELIEFTCLPAGHSRSLVSQPRRTASSASVASSTAVSFFPFNIFRQ